MFFTKTRNTLISSLILLFLIIASGSFAGLAAAETKSLTIGLLPEMNVFKQQQRFKPLASFLSENLDIKVKLSIISRYGNIIQRIKDENIDAAFLGSFTGALAITQLGVEPLARPINLDGTSTYFGHIFVRKDSGIDSVSDMKGKSLALVERATTAGYVFPLAWLKRNGVKDVETYFNEHFFAGSHDATIEAVLTGQATVGAGKNTIYDRMRATNPRIDKELIILASSPRVPSNALCVRPGLDETDKTKLKELLLNLHHSPKGLDILAKLGAKRFVETNREDYQPVIDLAAEAGIDIQNYKYYNP